jgi:hypothetical protein
MKLRFVIGVMLVALTIAVQPTVLGQTGSTFQQPSEDDWSLPSWVQRTPNSGLYGGFNLPAGVTTLKLATVTWRQLNPADGTYNWAPLDNLLEGTPFILRLYNTDVIHSPTWLRSKYPNLTALRFRWPNMPYQDTLGNTSPGDFYPPWHPGVEAEFHKFLLAFKARNYAANPKMRGWYIPGGWEWNEWSLKWVPEMTRQGITPPAFLGWFKRLMTDYVSATNGQPEKLIYTGTPGEEWVEWTGDATSHNAWVAAINPAEGTNAMSSTALHLGAGARHGSTEWFNYTTQAPDWGMTIQTINGARYMVTNDAHPFLADTTRFFGTENECWGQCGMPAGTNDYYHVKMSTLKALQLRMNWVFLGNYNLAPPIFQYMLKTLGKRVSDSPDAWVALREAEDRERGTPGPVVRNWERWIVQREVAPDGLTVRTAPITSPATQIGTSYEARRTDRATANNYMYFGVDDQFVKGGPEAVDLYVTYLDNNHATWMLQYDSATGGAYKSTRAVTNIGDGKWKTTKFAITDAGFDNRQNGGMDFRLYNGGAEDVTVRFVRVVKVNAPAAVPAPPARPTGLRIVR